MVLRDGMARYKTLLYLSSGLENNASFGLSSDLILPCKPAQLLLIEDSEKSTIYIIGHTNCQIDGQYRAMFDISNISNLGNIKLYWDLLHVLLVYLYISSAFIVNYFQCYKSVVISLRFDKLNNS